MICIRTAKKYCRDDISLIKNYDKAVSDTEHMWDCHHRLEFTLDGKYARSVQDLMRLNMYYKRPYFELIFLTKSEHKKIHNGAEEYRRKMSEAQKYSKYADERRRNIGKALAGRTKSEFGRKFKEHYGITKHQDANLYHREHYWYRNHNNKCRWE